MYELNAPELTSAIEATLKANQVPFITGSPGVGKSDIVKQVANKYNLELIDIRLSQADPTELNGFPQIVDGKMSYVPPANFPLITDEIPKGKDGWLIFLDEMNSAPPAVQAASYKVLLDKVIDNTPIHPNVRMVAAGNKDTDRAIVNRMSTATQSRLIHFSLDVDYQSWIDWANKNKIDHRIISFIKFKPEVLHHFDPNHDDHTFPSPRTWSFLSTLIKGVDKFDKVYAAIMAGTVGAGASNEFKNFSEIYQDLPTIEYILENPTTWKVPQEPSRQYALTTMFSHNINEENVDTCISAIERLPIEFQVITIKDIYKSNPALQTHEGFKKWIAAHSSELY